MSDFDEDGVLRARAAREYYRSQARRDRHADNQARYRDKLRTARAPSRADVAAVTLGVVILICRQYPLSPKVGTIRRMIVNELENAGFDSGQIIRRLDNMIERGELDLAKWRATRAWHEARRRRRSGA